ncbi:unnamed protein product [Heterotrigona itama]|uniref:CHHC U11-48K-type domain-containing protein n=1 Tax=Heterotrigona itama TaxID=395501 RepID=A0A6V7HGK5_9HYME|nr:unnamed protein product [Heterotrigona itama]
MLNSAMNERESQCQNLDNFTKKIHQEIVEITSSLNWTMESIKADNDNMLVCPYDSSHQISNKILYRHLECCQWKQEGYNEFDIPLPESYLPLNSYSSIKLGSDERLIPRTSNRIFTDFTCDERKILYDYVTSNTVKPDIGHDITDIQKLKSHDKEHKKLSFLELLIQERNLKRRRAKHRGVHTNKKSHIEVLREVIQQQMKLYSDYLTERTTDDKTITETQNSNNSPNDVVNKFPSKYNDDLTEDPQDRRGNSSSQYNKKYEHYEKSYTTYPRDSKQEGSLRSTTESWKAQKTNVKHKHKRKRSHSKERNHDRKSKHRSTRTHHKKSRKNEKSFDNDTYSKRSSDRRENHEKLI